MSEFRNGQPARQPVVAKVARLGGACLLSVLALQVQAGGGPQRLSLADFQDLLLERNQAVKASRLQSRIAETAIPQAEGRFQPRIRLSVVKGETNEINSPEDKATRGDTDFYERRYHDLIGELSMLLPSGGTVGAKTTLSRFWSTSFETYSSDPDLVDKDRVRATYAVEFEQPLARDLGRAVAEAPVSIARLDSEIARLEADDAKALTLGEGVNAFYDLLAAQYQRDAARQKVEMAESLLQTAEQLERAGRIDRSAVADVEISVAQLKTGLIETEQQVRDFANLTRKLLLLDPVTAPGRLEVSSPLPASPQTLPPMQDLLQDALASRADYLARRTQIERSGVELGFYQNQIKPRVDAKVSYGYSGLALQGTDAYTGEYRAEDPTWSIGVTLDMPLGRDKEMWAQLEAARLRQQQARDDLSALATEIANDLDTAVGLVESASARWSLWADVFAREQAKHSREEQRFAAGRSDIRSLLLSQERMINTELQLREQQVAYLRARQLLAITQTGELFF